ncbi:hypothetical protein BJV78DRAFT_1259257 [Lactifluus subvellereus]|nr:hypothetical protein BJV78DRAFT_1259257 [Lactifluus subvellereus]
MPFNTGHPWATRRLTRRAQHMPCLLSRRRRRTRPTSARVTTVTPAPCSLQGSCDDDFHHHGTRHQHDAGPLALPFGLAVTMTTRSHHDTRHQCDAAPPSFLGSCDDNDVHHHGMHHPDTRPPFPSIPDGCDCEDDVRHASSMSR